MENDRSLVYTCSTNTNASVNVRITTHACAYSKRFTKVAYKSRFTRCVYTCVYNVGSCVNQSPQAPANLQLNTRKLSSFASAQRPLTLVSIHLLTLVSFEFTFAFESHALTPL